MQSYTNPECAMLLDATRALQPRIMAIRSEIERERRLPPLLVQEMAAAGIFRMMTPRDTGGLEVDPLTAFQVIEAVSEADGSAVWIALINGAGGFFAGRMNDQLVDEIWGRDANAIISGAISPKGKAVEAEGGYRVSGHWTFGSGIQHCTWAVGGCLLVDRDGQPLMEADGQPRIVQMLFPPSDFTVIDTWHVGGLRGTGSHDWEVHDRFVPAHRSFALSSPPSRPGPLYTMGVVPPLLMAAVALGIARSAISALVEMAAVKTPVFAQAPLRERPLAQQQVANAEALVRSGRAFVVEVISALWECALAERRPSLKDLALAPLAATKAVVSAIEAVDLMYTAAGGSALYTSCLLERALRDVHAVGQHMMVQQMNYETAGRMLLGLEPQRPIGF